MMKSKKIISSVMAVMLAMGIATPAFAESYSATVSSKSGVVTSTSSTASKAPEKATANPTTSKIYVDGQEVAFDAYNINDNNYFKLRDVAWALSGTDAQFNVDWNDEAKVINLVSGTDYGKNGSLSVGDGKSKAATLNTAPIMKDGEYVTMTAYNIGGNNYFKLRDLGVQFGFEVGWDGTANAVAIDTDGVVDEIEKEEVKVATDEIRWDLISTEWCTVDLIPGEEYGLPSYMIVYIMPGQNGFRDKSYAIDARTGRKYPLNLDNTIDEYYWKEIRQITTENQTFKECELHAFPKVGDTVIKENGETITLTATIIGNFDVTMLLGFEQGVDVITGVETPMGHLKDYSDAGDGFYKKCDLTHEVFTNVEWHAIDNVLNPNRKYVGDYDGEIYHSYWKWNANAKQHITGEQGRWDWLGPQVAA